MSKYSDKKKRQAEMHPKIDAFVERAVSKFKARQTASVAADDARRLQAQKDEEKRIAKYNRARAEARNARSNTRRGIRELSNPELIVIARELEKKIQMWKAADVMGELRRRFVLALGLSAEIQASLLNT